MSATRRSVDGAASGDGEVAVLFSGGLDTTLAALRLAERFRRVHLLTFDNGLCFGVRRLPLRRVRQLQRRLGPAAGPQETP